MYVYKSWIKAVFNCSSETHKVLRVLYKEEPSALSLKSDTERHLVFWSEKWWVNSRVYFLENILTITWQFTFKKSSECTSYINHSLVTQIILRLFFSALPRWGRREREVPEILKGLGEDSSEFIAFAILGRSLSPYKRYSLAPFWTTTDPVEESSHKRRTNL